MALVEFVRLPGGDHRNHHQSWDWYLVNHRGRGQGLQFGLQWQWSDEQRTERHWRKRTEQPRQQTS
jgi:hypothetical protein